LKSVVFPAPFGPIKPTISPRGTSNETFFSAAIPPNSIPTFRTTSNGSSPRAADLENSSFSGVRLRGGLSIDFVTSVASRCAALLKKKRPLRSCTRVGELADG